MGENRIQSFPTGLFFPRHQRYFFLLAFLIVAALCAVGDHPAVAQSLFLDPSVSTPTEFNFTVDIAIDCQGQAVKGVEGELTFDPLLVRLDAVTAGPWYTGTGQEYYFFDYTGLDLLGTIHFASSVLDGTNNQSLTIAVCHFTVLAFGTSPVTWQDVDVRGPDNMDLGFGNSTDDLIIIDPAVPTVATSFGRLKVLFR